MNLRIARKYVANGWPWDKVKPQRHLWLRALKRALGRTQCQGCGEHIIVMRPARARCECTTDEP